MSKLSERLNKRRQVPEEEYYQDPEVQQQIQQQYQHQYQQQMQQRQQIQEDDEEHRDDRSPLSIVKEIKENPSQKGTFEAIIGGVPVDLHILEDYLVRTSPFALKTVMRYHNARNMEEIKNYSRGPNLKVNNKFWILIIMAVAIMMLGIFVIMFMPQIMQTFQGGAGF